MLLAGVLCAASTAASQELRLNVVPSEEVAGVGDVVTWTFTAELLNPDPSRTLLAVVNEIEFDVSHQGDTGVEISNNALNPAFDGLFGSDNGTVSGSSITGVTGFQDPPLLVPDPVIDSSNPLVIYEYDMLITDGSPRVLKADVDIIGQFSGSYTLDDFPFQDVFFYQLADGSLGQVPFTFGPLLFERTLTIVPTPASAALLGIAGVGLVGRRR